MRSTWACGKEGKKNGCEEHFSSRRGGNRKTGSSRENEYALIGGTAFVRNMGAREENDCWWSYAARLVIKHERRLKRIRAEENDEGEEDHGGDRKEA